MLAADSIARRMDTLAGLAEQQAVIHDTGPFFGVPGASLPPVFPLQTTALPVIIEIPSMETPPAGPSPPAYESEDSSNSSVPSSTGAFAPSSTTTPDDLSSLVSPLSFACPNACLMLRFAGLFVQLFVVKVR